MIGFAGWEMPVQYESALKEHLAVRESVGIFDVSHMGQIEIRGRDALAFTQKITCNDVARLSDGKAQYSAFLNEEGGFVDDIVIYRIGPEHVFICVNAANTKKDYQWILRHREGEVEIANTSLSYAQIAVQGPRSLEVLQELTPADLGSVPFYGFLLERVLGADSLISRTGYTGEEGFEIYVPPDRAEAVWRKLLHVGARFGIVSAGLAARNTLRLEVRFLLYGNDMDESTTPWEADLGWIVKLGKGDFVGKAALEKQREAGLRRRLVGFEMVDRGIARDRYPVFVNATRAAEVRSGSFAPSLQKAIGLVYLPAETTAPGSAFEVEVRGRRLKAQVVSTPFYKPRPRR